MGTAISGAIAQSRRKFSRVTLIGVPSESAVASLMRGPRSNTEIFPKTPPHSWSEIGNSRPLTVIRYRTRPLRTKYMQSAKQWARVMVE